MLPVCRRVSLHSAGALAEVGIGVGLGLADAAVWAVRSGREIAGEAVRTLPRLARLGGLQPHTKVSLGGLMAEQANRAPEGECFLFDDRVHTNAAVDHRIDEVVRVLIAVGIRQGARIGVLMDTSPSAVVAIAALSRLGAVAVLLPPDDDLARGRPPVRGGRHRHRSRPSGGGRRDRRQGADPRSGPPHRRPRSYGVRPDRRARPPRPVR